MEIPTAAQSFNVDAHSVSAVWHAAHAEGGYSSCLDGEQELLRYPRSVPTMTGRKKKKKEEIRRKKKEKRVRGREHLRQRSTKKQEKQTNKQTENRKKLEEKEEKKVQKSQQPAAKDAHFKIERRCQQQTFSSVAHVPHTRLVRLHATPCFSKCHSSMTSSIVHSLFKR
jgi:hypothetical protein